MAMGENHVTKTGIMAEDGLLPLLALASGTIPIVSSSIAAWAHWRRTRIRARIVELGGLVTVVTHGKSDDLEIDVIAISLRYYAKRWSSMMQ